MSWHSPFLDRPSSPWRGVQKALNFANELEAGGVEAGTPEWRQSVEHYFGQEVDDRCRCGRRLRIFELGSETCYACYEAREAAATSVATSQEARMAAMGVPPCYQHCTLERFVGDLPAELDSWICAPSRPLVIFGASPGTGKTHLGTAALYSASNGGIRCYWISAIVLAKRLSEETFADVKETSSRSAKVGLLMVDDLGREDGVVPRAREMVSALLDERHQYNRPTIVTTNLVHLDPAGELVVDRLVAYDARLASRLLSGTIIAREGEDQRWR